MRRTIRNSMMTMKRTCHNRIFPLVLSALLVLGSFLAGCSRTDRRSGIDRDSAQDGVYTIYYMNPEGTALVSQSYKTTSEDFEGRLSELLTAFMAPNSTQYRSALPEGVKINSSADFAQALLEKGLVAVVPGEAFGAPGYVRWSYATSMENIREGLDRLEKFLSE